MAGHRPALRYTRPLGLFGLWQPQPDAGTVHAELRELLETFDTREAVHPQSGVPVLRVRTDVAPANDRPAPAP